jgi:RHS repeat-associated protein
VTERFSFDGMNIWADLDGSNALTTRRVFGDQIEQLLCKVEGSNLTHYLTDHLGSIRDLTNNNGTVLNHLDYGGFGDITSESSPSNGDRYVYAGFERNEETGDYYSVHRWYNPKTGKWLTLDPIGFSARDTNLYRYVFNNSTNYTDPDGLWGWPSFGNPFAGAMQQLRSAANELNHFAAGVHNNIQQTQQSIRNTLDQAGQSFQQAVDAAHAGFRDADRRMAAHAQWLGNLGRGSGPEGQDVQGSLWELGVCAAFPIATPAYLYWRFYSIQRESDDLTQRVNALPGNQGRVVQQSNNLGWDFLQGLADGSFMVSNGMTFGLAEDWWPGLSPHLARIRSEYGEGLYWTSTGCGSVASVALLWEYMATKWGLGRATAMVGGMFGLGVGTDALIQGGQLADGIHPTGKYEPWRSVRSGCQATALPLIISAVPSVAAQTIPLVLAWGFAHGLGQLHEGHYNTGAAELATTGVCWYLTKRPWTGWFQMTRQKPVVPEPVAPGRPNFVTNEGVPSSRVGTGRAVSIYGEGVRQHQEDSPISPLNSFMPTVVLLHPLWQKVV